MVKDNNIKGRRLSSTAPEPPPPVVEEEEEKLSEEPIYANMTGEVGLHPAEEELAYYQTGTLRMILRSLQSLLIVQKTKGSDPCRLTALHCLLLLSFSCRQKKLLEIARIPESWR